MKKTIILFTIVFCGSFAFAQSDVNQNVAIDTNDATIKYLLHRIEGLEHKVAFDEDANNFQKIVYDYTIKWEQMFKDAGQGVSYQEIKSDAKEWFDAMEDLYLAAIEKYVASDIRYSYTDTEKNQINATCGLIGVYRAKFKMFLGIE